MDTNKLAALLQQAAGSGDTEQVLREAGNKLEAVGQLQRRAGDGSVDFTVQIDGRTYSVAVFPPIEELDDLNAAAGVSGLVVPI